MKHSLRNFDINLVNNMAPISRNFIKNMLKNSKNDGVTPNKRKEKMKFW